MRALLDTNIIIHRENKKVTNYSIGHLFRWLDKLKYEKIIHPYSVEEIRNYKDDETQQLMSVKLESYEIMKTIQEPDANFLDLLGYDEETSNDKIDNCLLFEVYSKRVDILITEDRKLREKASKIGIQDKVFSINSFISWATSSNPELIEYKMLAVKKTYFGAVDVKNPFFDSFRLSYPNFEEWFAKKCDEEAYICNDDEGGILGFLYLKTEDTNENYADIQPAFRPLKRLKVGTFKVESTGFRLGERFIKIIFDNALHRQVDEIYVTLYTDRPELSALADLMKRWGFVDYGWKTGNGQEKEKVLVKRLNVIEPYSSIKENFPNISKDCKKFILPIYAQYHTTLLPDSKLNNENEIDFIGQEAHKYALQKVYISWGNAQNVHSGDFILFYRMGTEDGRKKYTSVLTTVGIVDEIIENIPSCGQLLALCQNRSVFSEMELRTFWNRHANNLKVLKFIFVKSLTKRLTLEYLWNHGIVDTCRGPRPFHQLTNAQYNQILRDSETDIQYVE